MASLSQDGINPVFVSVGHLIDLRAAAEPQLHRSPRDPQPRRAISDCLNDRP